MKHVLALTFGDAATASTHFRILQYRDFLASEGIECDWFPANDFCDFTSLGKYDVVILQKKLIPIAALRKLRNHAKRLLYDADDLIWISPEKRHSFITRFRITRRLRAIAAAADLCLAANRVIASDLEAHGGRTAIVPMALDGKRWQDPVKDEVPLTIGWSGAPKNLVFLQEILPQLREVQRRHPEVRWAIHSGLNPCFDNFVYTHFPFVAEREHETIASFHIGLLPLPNNRFACGKSPIKALQYFACRTAVAAAPLGATGEIVRDCENGLWVQQPSEWVNVLERLISDAPLRHRLANSGRHDFIDNYELSIVGRQLAAAIRNDF